MFRQVIAYRWAEGVTDDDKVAFAAALDGLRAIPELTSLRFASDARHFDGNFDMVAVMDFPDFPAARRYVAHDLHQAYIRAFASTMIGERVVVQHDWALGAVAGVRRVTLPVADVARSSDWYARAFGFTAQSAPSDPAEVTMHHLGASITLVLRADPVRAAALAGFGVVAFSASTVADLDALVAHLDAEGIAHGAQVSSSSGVTVDVADPDGLVVQVTTLLAS